MPDADAEPVLPKVAAGDRAAVRECLSRYGGLVWSLSRRFFGAGPDAEDAAQEVFIALWTGAGRYDPSVASETVFVAMVARRTLIDRLRKSGRRPEPVPLPDGLPDPGLETPDGPAELRDEAARAARAFARLSDDQRRVLTMAVHGGQTYDAIARATGLPLGTVKTHARRGLIRLRELLDAPEPRPLPEPSERGRP